MSKFLIGFASLCALCGTTRFAMADGILVSWTLVQHVVRPEPKTQQASKSVQVTLQGGNALVETRSVANNGRSSARTGTGSFNHTLDLAKTIKSSWRVLNARTLVRKENRAQHVELVTVRMTGSATCKADVSYQLKPGFREYKVLVLGGKGSIFLDRIHIERTSCVVQVGG
jgi:hypothetical protein